MSESVDEHKGEAVGPAVGERNSAVEPSAAAVQDSFPKAALAASSDGDGRFAARINCVRHRYEDGSKVELCGLEFAVERGQRVAVLGPNGSGKTTLFFHLVGILRPSEGAVSVLGVDPAHDFAKVRQRIGVVLQNVDEQLLAPTVWDDVSFSPRQYGLPRGEVKRLTEQALERIGIGHLRDKVPHYLSGGEKRKVAIAGALVMEPELLILDEPFEGLDPHARQQVLDLLNRLVAERGMTLITSTHDVNLVPEMADDVYVLAQGGHIVLHGTPAEVFAHAEVLQASNIEPPVLARLFEDLTRRTGVHLPMPASLEEAADRLAQIIGTERPGAQRAGQDQWGSPPLR